jgi:hypothetical protein
MKYKKYHIKRCLFAIFSLFLFFTQTGNLLAQNIFSGEPVQIVGSMNSYSTITASNSVYRRISVNTGNPVDGRGQWVKTYRAAPIGGNVTNSNMSGGSGNGFLFISGPSTNRFQNKWVFSNVSQAKLDSTNTCNAFNSGNDMGLNMSDSGFYTFVFNDCGYTSANARFYVAFTPTNPITISSQSITANSNNTSQIGIQTYLSPSNKEFVYVRYTTGNSFASTGISSIVQANSTNVPLNTNWMANIPAQSNGTILRYYIFTSSLSLTKLNAMSEMDKSLACISVLDNGGNNYTYSFAKKFSIGFRVDMGSNICSGFDSVSVIGNNNAFGFWTNAFKLSNIPSSNIYGLSLLIDSSSILEFKYRFHKNGITTWESNFSTGSGNRELVLNKDTVLGSPCFNSLSSSCPSAPAPSTITFLTDLSNATPDTLGRVYVMGNFTNPTWSAGALRMFPVSGMPGYFQRIVPNVCPTTFEFKFINGDSSLANTPENFPNPLQRACTVSNGVGGFNRTYTRTSSNPVNLYFVFDSCTIALPVQLLEFNANQTNEGILLNWKTASEQNNKGFWVEASKNGIDFETIGFVEGKGNSNQLNTYSFIVNKGSNYQYFRLKQEDFDGKSTFSETTIIENNSLKFGIEIYPNPFENEISIKFKQSGNYDVLVYDLLGNEVIKSTHIISENKSLVNINGFEFLKSGVFIIQVKNEEIVYKEIIIKK